MISILCVLLFPGVEMVYIFARLSEQNIHFNEFDKADIKSHSYKINVLCSCISYDFLCKTFETVSKMTRIGLF